MDIYLIRHTKTDTPQGLCYGQSDVPLADSFAVEAQRIRGKLSGLSDDCLVISSPLSRCLRLAESLQKTLITDSRLQEVNFGRWENRSFDDIDPTQLKHWTDHFVTIPPPDGESFGALCQRVSEFWLELLANAPADQVVLVTHAGVIRALYAHVLQLLPAHAFKIRVDAGSVHKLRHSNQYTYIDYVNL